MDAAIYMIADHESKTNDLKLNLVVDRIKSEGKQYKIFSELFDKKGKQPLKEDLLLRVGRMEFDTIMIYKLTDWASSLSKLSSELYDLHKKGVRIISVSENFDTNTKTGMFYLQMLFAYSEFENDIALDLIGLIRNRREDVGKHLAKPQRPEKKVAGGNPARFIDYNEQIQPGSTLRSENNMVHRDNVRNRNYPGRTESFDLIGMDEACELTGYSRNTLYQLTSKKLIPHFKRPSGRRIFFSKRALEQWILTGSI